MNILLMCVEGWLANNFKGNFKVNSLSVRRDVMWMLMIAWDCFQKKKRKKKRSSVKLSDGQINADVKNSFFQ